MYKVICVQSVFRKYYSPLELFIKYDFVREFIYVLN